MHSLKRFKISVKPTTDNESGVKLQKKYVFRKKKNI